MLKPISSPRRVAVVEGRKIRRGEEADGRHGAQIGDEIAGARIGVVGQRLRQSRAAPEQKQQKGEAEGRTVSAVRGLVHKDGTCDLTCYATRRSPVLPLYGYLLSSY